MAHHYEWTPDRIDIAPKSERLAAGRSLRSEVPLDALAECPAPQGRPDPIAILRAQDVNRQQDLVPIRHGRMSATPFTFYRGAAAIMASDLAMTPSSGLHPQICGDAHLSNFGIFNGADHRLVFDLNDFDETLPGPFEWDVKRLAASIVVAGRNNELSAKKIARATRAAVAGYRETIEKSVEMSPRALHYFRLDVEEFQASGDAKDQRRAKKVVKKASKKNSLRAFNKLTEVVDGRPQIVSDPPLIERLSDEAREQALDEIQTFFNGYLDTLLPHRCDLLERYRMVDLAQKVVGVGSVGTRCWIVYLTSGDGDPLFLQIKEATTSVLEPHLEASVHDQAGRRVVRGQQLMQATGDIFLGWSRFLTDTETADFYFRQLWDGKASVDVDDMGPKRLRRYAHLCGGTLALAHARSLEPAIISGYIGDDETFDHVIADFAEHYADLNELDHAAHDDEIESGRLEVIRDI